MDDKYFFTVGMSVLRTPNTLEQLLKLIQRQPRMPEKLKQTNHSLQYNNGSHMTSSYFNYFHWEMNIICSCSFNSFSLKKDTDSHDCKPAIITTAQQQQQQHPFNSRLSGTNQVSRYQKGKTNLRQ